MHLGQLQLIRQLVMTLDEQENDGREVEGMTTGVIPLSNNDLFPCIECERQRCGLQ